MSDPKDDLEKMRAADESATFDWEMVLKIKAISTADFTKIDYPRDQLPQKYQVGRTIGTYTVEDSAALKARQEEGLAEFGRQIREHDEQLKRAMLEQVQPEPKK